MLRTIIVFSLISSLFSPAWANSEQVLQTLVQQKKFRSAIQSGEKLMARQPQSARVKFLTAYAYQMNRQMDKAEVLYRQLISQHPYLPEPRNNLAIIYQANGDYDAASKLLVEAIETHESYATAYQNLSRIYTAIASEAYRRALSESTEPAKYTHKIELAALSQLNIAIDADEPENPAQDSSEEMLNRQDIAALLKKRVMDWASAWSNKDFPAYTSFYSIAHHPDFDSHSEWLEYRRQRILRPGFLKISISDIQIRAQDNESAIIDFKQSFDSPGYSDRVVKRLGFRLIGDQWQIVDEKVLSVL